MANKPTAMKNDAIGNPTTWYDGTSFTWANGRRLASATNTDEGLSATYTYDADGLRLTKTINGVEHKYLWQGSKLVSEYYDGKELEFFYDESGNPYAFSYKASSTATPVMYYYLTNLQGDVTGILDSSGTTVAAYTYNAWGKILSSSGTLADLNPLRYRGYYYDSETGLYYVSSRYYDPEIGRWINTDGYVSTGQGVLGNNMFAYCGNNPVNRVDPTGQFWKELLDAFTQTIQQASGYFAVAAGVSQVDTLAPGPADVVSGVLLLGGVLLCAGIATYTVITAPTPSISIPKTEEKAEVIPTTPSSSTVIYRYGGTNPGNLTPKAKDKYSGLSFSTVPMPGAATTTIEALNATGVVYAVKDGPTHVSVRPVGATMEDWINAGSGSIWTQAVKSVVIKWGGGF